VSELEEKIIVDCPVSQAKLHIDSFFEEYVAKTDGTEPKAALTLRAPLSLPGVSGVTLERDVHVSLKRQKRPVDAFDALDVRWEVPEGGPYPKFDGTLSVEANDDYDTFSLVLRGSYTPPGGIAGQAFDMALGHRIAEATARDLLERVKTDVEDSHHRVEEIKRAKRAAQGVTEGD